MCELLSFEADRRSFMTTFNSFWTELNKEERTQLNPKVRKLYPDGLAVLGRTDDTDQVRMLIDYYGVS